MNWDITIGQVRLAYGRLLQRIGTRVDRRGLVLKGEAMEYAGRLQHRYGALKHQAQWNMAPDAALVRVAHADASKKRIAI